MSLAVEEKEKFLEWLSAPDFEKRHLEVYSKKHPRTGGWLLDNEKFRSWLHGPKQGLLWVNGKRMYSQMDRRLGELRCLLLLSCSWGWEVCDHVSYPLK